MTDTLVILVALTSSWIKYDTLRDLVPFVQFENGEKHPWSSAGFNKVAGSRATHHKYSYHHFILT